MKKIVIASACRTAIGKFGGTIANVPAAELGSIVIKEALNRANVKPEQVDHVYMGCVIQAGLGQNVARQASLKAGLPIETPAVTVNVVCGSGLNCVNMAAQMIEAGDADIVVAGGMENMDMAPFAMMKGRYGYRMGAPMGKSELVDTMVNDALWDATGFNKHMGMTAENVCTNETYQKKYGYNPITREQLDEFSYNSQVKADKAIKDGMKGMAVTDHGVMFGIKELTDYCAKVNKDRKKEGLEPFKPIIGCEMYVARRRKEDREKDQGDMSGYHLIVLAKNYNGYKNLIKLVSNSWVDGYYMRPRTDRADLEKYHEDLIVCSACIAGEVPRKILNGDIEGAREA